LIIAGMDIATLKSGIAVIESDGKAYLYSLILHDKTPLEARIQRHGEWARDIAARHKIEVCFHEEVIQVKHGGGFTSNGKSENIRTALMIAQVLGAVKEKFYPAVIHPLTPSEWRAQTVGNIPARKGMSERDALKAAAISFTIEHGLTPKSDDEAEAYLIALAGSKLISV